MISCQIHHSTSGAVELVSTSKRCDVQRYIPKMPEQDDAGNFKPVTEEIEVVYTNTAQAKTDLALINKAFHYARQRAQMPGRITPATFRVQHRSSDAQLYSPILDGTATFGYFKNDRQVMRIAFTRDPYFEDATETALPCGGTTGGYTIYNHTSGGSLNYFQLTTTGLTGDMPTPVRWEITNTSTGAGEKVGDLWIGALRGATLWDGILQGESATATASASGSNVSVGTASGGSVKRITVRSFPDQAGVIPPDSYRLLDWTIDYATMTLLNGRTYKPFLKMSGTLPSDCQFWLALDFLEHDPVELNTALANSVAPMTPMPPMRLPAQSVIAGSADAGFAATVSLYGRKMTTGNATNVDVDYVQFVPTDQLRYLRDVGELGAAPNYTIHDDPYTGIAFTRTNDVTPRRQATWAPLASPIMVYPGETCHVHMVHQFKVGSGPNFNARTLSVKAFAKSRRLVI